MSAIPANFACKPVGVVEAGLQKKITKMDFSREDFSAGIADKHHNLAAWIAEHPDALKALSKKDFEAVFLAIGPNLAVCNAKHLDGLKALPKKDYEAEFLAIRPNLVACNAKDLEALKALSKKDFEAEFLAIKPNLAAWNAAPMFATVPKTRLIVARPLRELRTHIRNRRLPSLRLVARAIKVLALSIFRWHLCDNLMIQVEDSLFHNQKNRIERCARENFQKYFPYLFQNALQYEFIPNICLTEIQIRTMKQINAQSLVELCKRCAKISLTLKEKGNTVRSLFKSKQLKVLSK